MPENTVLREHHGSISRPPLADVEAQTIGALIYRGFGPGAQVDPRHAFPVQSEDHIEALSDWACRFLLECLAGKGCLRRVRITGEPLGLWPIEMTQEAVDAYRAWYDRRGHMGDDPNALLP